MARFEGADARRRYRRLIDARPDLARNPSDAGIEILLDPQDIARAEAEARRARESSGLDGDDYRAGLLAEDVYMTFVRDAVRFGDGTLGLYNRILEGPCVAVLPLLDGRPVLIRIFRHALREWCWEAPRGDVGTDEDLAAAATREISEEIGARVQHIESLGRFTPGGASLGILGHLFLAEVDGVGSLARAESIVETRVVTIDEMKRMIASEEVYDGFTIALFTRAQAKGLI